MRTEMRAPDGSPAEPAGAICGAIPAFFTISRLHIATWISCGAYYHKPASPKPPKMRWFLA